MLGIIAVIVVVSSLHGIVAGTLLFMHMVESKPETFSLHMQNYYDNFPDELIQWTFGALTSACCCGHRLVHRVLLGIYQIQS